jgi:hypothetical protein
MDSSNTVGVPQCSGKRVSFILKVRYKSALPLLVPLTKAPVMCALQETNKCHTVPTTRLFGKYSGRAYLKNIFLVIAIAISRIVYLAAHPPRHTPICFNVRTTVPYLIVQCRQVFGDTTTSSSLTRKQTMAIPLACHICQISVGITSINISWGI